MRLTLHTRVLHLLPVPEHEIEAGAQPAHPDDTSSSLPSTARELAGPSRFNHHRAVPASSSRAAGAAPPPAAAADASTSVSYASHLDSLQSDSGMESVEPMCDINYGTMPAMSAMVGALADAPDGAVYRAALAAAAAASACLLYTSPSPRD